MESLDSIAYFVTVCQIKWRGTVWSGRSNLVSFFYWKWFVLAVSFTHAWYFPKSLPPTMVYKLVAQAISLLCTHSQGSTFSSQQQADGIILDCVLCPSLHLGRRERKLRLWDDCIKKLCHVFRNTWRFVQLSYWDSRVKKRSCRYRSKASLDF